MPPDVHTIDRFDGTEYGFLSNFYPSPIVMPSWHPCAGVVAPTVEHAFQAAKTENAWEALAIMQAHSPGAAKRMGRRVSIRPGWDDGRVVVMLALLRLKFADDALRDALLGTGYSLLVEGNTWRDTFWGVYQNHGDNVLGRLLMLVRTELRGYGPEIDAELARMLTAA